MRLVVLGPGHPFRGGIARTTTELVSALERRGHEVTFLTPVRQYPSRLFPGHRDRDPAACPKLDCATPILDPFAPTSWPRARAAARSVRADAWIFPYWTWPWAGLWRFLLADRERPPTVAVVHNLEDHDAGLPAQLAARIVLARCDGAFTHARALARVLGTTGLGLAVGSHPLPPPTSAAATLGRREARAALGLPEEGRIALFLGLIRPYKGVDRLVEAAALSGASDWSILVAGEPWGREGERLQRQVRRLGLGGRVLLRLGWVAEELVAAYLAAADVLVLPYRRASQSAVAPMALAAGLPVVCSAVGGLPEVVENGVSGLLVGAGEPAELAAALARLDRTELERLAVGARRRAGELTWDGYAGALEELLMRVVR